MTSHQNTFIMFHITRLQMKNVFDVKVVHVHPLNKQLDGYNPAYT